MNPNIALSYRGFQMESPMNQLAQLMQLQGAQQQNQLGRLQMQEYQRRAAEDERKRNALSELIQSLPSPEMASAQNALAGGGGPTMANAARMQPVDPRIALLHRAMKAGAVSPVDYIGAAYPQAKPDDYKVVGNSLVKIGPLGVTEAFKSDMTEKTPENIRALEAIYGKGTPELREALQKLGQKMVTHTPGVSVSYGAPVAGVDPQGNPVFFQPSKAGGQPAIIPGVAPAAKEDKALTEGQAKAVTFSARMLAAEKVLSDLSRKGVNKTIPGASMNNAVGDVLTAISPADQQLLLQAKRDFINATLRRESGATIQPEEFASADRQYFPQPGDSRVVIEQKARNRRAAIEGIRADVPKNRQEDVDRIANGSPASAAAGNDPLGLRGK